MTYSYINGIILNGNVNMEPINNKVIIVENDKILKIIHKNDYVNNNYKEINLNGAYIMPGLINMHVHLPASGKPSKKPKDNKKMVALITKNKLMRSIGLKIVASYAKQELLSGVTTIRTVGGVADFDTITRDKINACKLAGPRIIASNMAVSVPDGHMAGSLAYEAKSKEEAVKYVDKIISEKTDLIKLMITGGVLDARVKGEPGEMKMDPAIIEAACTEAHKHGLVVAAHVESTTGVKEALKNGVDTIEHGAFLDDECIDLFKEKKASLITTISPALPFALFDTKYTNVSEMEQYNGNVVFEGIVDAAKKALANNIPVGLGTDTGCPYITHYNMWRELYYFHKYCEVSNSYALYTATLGNAKILGLDKEIGSIEENKYADFIVTKGNPLENLNALRNIEMVVASGKVYSNKVKKYKVVEEVLDSYM